MTGTSQQPPSDAPPGVSGRIFGPQWRALTVGILAVVSLLAFEAMAVATAMPVAVRDLDGLPFYAWGFSAFFIASLVGMVVSGEVSDRRGPVLPFVVVAGAVRRRTGGRRPGHARWRCSSRAGPCRAWAPG